MTAALELDGVAKSYGDAPALSPVSLRIERGERVALIGHNGSGKTTMLRIAAGLLDASEGSVTVCGHASGSLGARAALSYVADQPTFYDDLTLWEHLEYVARLHGETGWEQNAADLLGHLGIYDRADSMPNRFSRGLKQKAALAIGFIRPFEVLMVDEPFVGLDSAGRRPCWSCWPGPPRAAPRCSWPPTNCPSCTRSRASRRCVTAASSMTVPPGTSIPTAWSARRTPQENTTANASRVWACTHTTSCPNRSATPTNWPRN